MAPWLFWGLADRGLPVVCIGVRQMNPFAKLRKPCAQVCSRSLMLRPNTASEFDCSCVIARR